MLTTSEPDDGAAFRYVPALDGLRGVAITLVFCFHAMNAVPPGALSSVLGHFSRGLVGVDVFFVLSGTLITLLIMHEVDRWGRFDARRFYERRALRLLPGVYLLVATLAIVIAIRGPAAGTQGFGWDALGAIFYYSNWIGLVAPYFNFHVLAHTWSLAIEEQFYILWPAILVLGIRRLRPNHQYLVVGAGAAASFGLYVWGEHHDWSQPRMLYAFDTHGGSLLVGCLVGLVIAHGHAPTSVRGRAVARRAATVGVLVAAAGLAYPSFLEHRSLSTLIMGTSLITAAVIVAVMVEPEFALTRALSLGPIRWLGRVSYNLYLWHYPVFVLIPAKDHPDWSVARIFATQVGLSFALTLFTYYGVEHFTRRWRRRLRPRPRVTSSSPA